MFVDALTFPILYPKFAVHLYISVSSETSKNLLFFPVMPAAFGLYLPQPSKEYLVSSYLLTNRF